MNTAQLLNALTVIGVNDETSLYFDSPDGDTYELDGFTLETNSDGDQQHLTFKLTTT